MTPPPRLVPDRPSDADKLVALEANLAERYRLCEDTVTPSSILLAVLNAVADVNRIDAAAPPAEAPAPHCGNLPDDFDDAEAPAERGGDFGEGDNAHLIECIDALVSLNDSGALVPHGIGGHARKLLLAAASRLAAAPAAPAEGVTVHSVIDGVGTFDCPATINPGDKLYTAPRVTGGREEALLRACRTRLAGYMVTAEHSYEDVCKSLWREIERMEAAVKALQAATGGEG